MKENDAKCLIVGEKRSYSRRKVKRFEKIRLDVGRSQIISSAKKRL